MSVRKLPSLPELINLFGVRRAFVICNELGGRRHYIPLKPDRMRAEGDGLNAVLTEEELEYFAEHYGGEYIMPAYHRVFCIQYLRFVEGRGYYEIAKELKCTEKHVGQSLWRRLAPEVERALKQEMAA